VTSGPTRLATIQTCLYHTSITDTEALMAKKIACTNVVPGCSFKAEAETEDELVEKVAAHAAHTHGITEVTPELLQQVRDAIHDQ
jgi:predicted small metal-binding protein